MIFRLLATGLLLLQATLSQAQLTILQYHHVDTTTPPSTSISPADFARHLQLLQDENMQVMDLATAMNALRAGETLPDKAVAITFDDAYLSIYKNAFPLLKARGWPFTVFVNTAAVDGHFGQTLSWDQLREMQASGALIANHSVNHPYLIDRPAGMTLNDWLNAEVEAAEQRLQAEMGTSPHMLAYPYGEFSLEIIDWLKARNYLAFGQQSGPVGPLSHPQALPRFPAAGIYADVKTLRSKLYTLALPVSPDQLQNPVLNDSRLPALTLSVPTMDFYARQLQCYASGEGAIKTEYQADGSLLTLTTQSGSPMRGGRSRYNCTAPSISHPGWYYWYSQPWINQSVSQR